MCQAQRRSVEMVRLHRGAKALRGPLVPAALCTRAAFCSAIMRDAARLEHQKRREAEILVFEEQEKAREKEERRVQRQAATFPENGGRRKRRFAFVTHSLKDKAFLQRLASLASAGPTTPSSSRGLYELDLEKALEEGQAETADALVTAVMQAPLRLVSKCWARVFSVNAIHSRYFCAARRLLTPVEAGQGLSRIFDEVAQAWHGMVAEDVWQCVLSELMDYLDEEPSSLAPLSIFAWESRPAQEELFARAAAGLKFYSTASEFANTPSDGSNPYVIRGLRTDFCDALVQREWFVDVESVKAEGDHATRFARELMPAGSLVTPPIKQPGKIQIVLSRGQELHEAERTRRAIRVVPFAYSAAKLADEVAHAERARQEWPDDRDYVSFCGGFALTADGNLPSLAHRNIDHGPARAAKLLERAAEQDQRAAENLREEAWDTTLPVAALEANSCALRAKAAVCHRASTAPTLYALCTLRALVAARRAVAPAAYGTLFRPSFPTELFRRICHMIGDGDTTAQVPGPVAVLDSVQIYMEDVEVSSTSWSKPRGEDSDEDSDPYGYAPKY